MGAEGQSVDEEAIEFNKNEKPWSDEDTRGLRVRSDVGVEYSYEFIKVGIENQFSTKILQNKKHIKKR